MVQRMLVIWSLVPLSFLSPAWTLGSSQFTYYWSLAWRILSITLWDESNRAVLWAFSGIAFLWDWNENGPFPVLWPLLSFLNLLAYWVQHFHSIIFNAILHCCCYLIPSVVSDSSQPRGLQPTSPLHPWDFPGKSTEVGCHCLLQYYTEVFQILTTFSIILKAITYLGIFLFCIF